MEGGGCEGDHGEGESVAQVRPVLRPDQHHHGKPNRQPRSQRTPNFTQLVNLPPGVVSQTARMMPRSGRSTANVATPLQRRRTEYNNWESMAGDNRIKRQQTDVKVSPNPDAIEEGKLKSTSKYGAQYGRNGYGTSKSKPNRHHSCHAARSNICVMRSLTPAPGRRC